jgi:hypothetical protein
MASHRVVVLAVACALAARRGRADRQAHARSDRRGSRPAAARVVATVPAEASRIIGLQDSPGVTFGTPEVLVTAGHGQRMVPGRNISSGGGRPWRRTRRRPTRFTVGWLRASQKRHHDDRERRTPSGELLVGDYLEPLQMPELPEGDIAVDTRGTRFHVHRKVLYGSEERRSSGAGEFMLIERGMNQDVTVGGHYAIYRDLKVTGTPLSSIGEATVVSVGPTMALIRINRSRDAVFSGDLAVPRK